MYVPFLKGLKWLNIFLVRCEHSIIGMTTCYFLYLRRYGSISVKHVFGEKDTVATRRDMEDVNRMSGLWLQQRGNSQNLFQPSAP